MVSYFDQISRNKWKSILLMTGFFVLFVAVIFIFTLFLGLGIFGLILSFILVGIYALITYYAGDKVILSISQAKEADRKQYPGLYNIVEGLALAQQLPIPKIYVMNEPNPNAFATGRSPKHASVVVTTGLLQIMNKDELEGVLAHEMSHVGNNDIQFMMIAIVFVGVIGIIAMFARSFLFFGGGDRRDEGIIIIIALIIGILAPIVATIVQLAISRKREYMADANGARLTRNPKGLSSALKKIQQYSQNPSGTPVKHATEVTSSLYFSNPLKGVSNLFSTHPPIEERIKILDSMY
ncbi:MAG: M48 family metalloprotease [Candidatus Marsarchaeota archaeon]|nr:M48 family metalloprotease [Candidatus Marsarchaeota archaeon]